MVRVGIVGIGFMGWIHWLAYQRVEGIEVAAIASRDPAKRGGDWRGIKGNFGPPGEQVALDDVACYETLEEMLADDSLDVIDICLPPHLHVDAAHQAFAAGKHVFCEKPLGLTTQQCDQIVQDAEANGKQLLVGQVLPFFPEYAKTRELIDSGQYGKPLGGRFKRVISPPTWIPDFYDLDRVGGPLIDLHVHDAHFIRMVFGMPSDLVAVGRRHANGTVQYSESLFRFPDADLVVSAVCGVIDQPGRAFTHGFEIHLERATLQYEFAVIEDQPVAMLPLTIFPAEGPVFVPSLGEGDAITAFELEITAVREAIETGEPSPILGGNLARDAIALCQRQAELI